MSKPVSTYFTGVCVGVLFAGTVGYIVVRTWIGTLADESRADEWIEFPTLDAVLAKADRQDKNSNIHVSRRVRAHSS
jgi:hypothetical protein